MELERGTHHGNLFHNLKFNLKEAIEKYGFPMVLQTIDAALVDLEITDEEYLKNFDLSIIYEKKNIDRDEAVKGRKLNIKQIASHYGLKLVGGRCVCPFHKGSKNPTSFHLDAQKNIFYCHSCGEKGDLFTFIKKMKELKNGNKK